MSLQQLHEGGGIKKPKVQRVGQMHPAFPLHLKSNRCPIGHCDVKSAIRLQDACKLSQFHVGIRNMFQAVAQDTDVSDSAMLLAVD